MPAPSSTFSVDREPVAHRNGSRPRHRVVIVDLVARCASSGGTFRPAVDAARSPGVLTEKRQSEPISCRVGGARGLQPWSAHPQATPERARGDRAHTHTACEFAPNTARSQIRRSVRRSLGTETARRLELDARSDAEQRPLRGPAETFDRSTQLRKLDQLVLALSEVGRAKRSWGPGASVARSGSAERNPAREGSTSPSGDDVLHCLHAEHRRQRRALLRG